MRFCVSAYCAVSTPIGATVKTPGLPAPSRRPGLSIYTQSKQKKSRLSYLESRQFWIDKEALVNQDSGLHRRLAMTCAFCTSSNQAEFPAEVNIHFPGLRNAEKPGLFVFPRLLVCLDCGFSSFMTPESEVTQLARITPARSVISRPGDRSSSHSAVGR
jgi:hypothetical protein